jgi:hypothetical protein
MPLIGFIHSASPSYFAQFAGAVRDGLNEAGYVEHQNVAIDYRWAEGHYDRLPAIPRGRDRRARRQCFCARRQECHVHNTNRIRYERRSSRNGPGCEPQPPRR